MNLFGCWLRLSPKEREAVELVMGETFPAVMVSDRDDVIAALLEREAKRWCWLTSFPRALPPISLSRIGEAHAAARKLMSC
jgi:hypothetical protein